MASGGVDGWRSAQCRWCENALFTRKKLYSRDCLLVCFSDERMEEEFGSGMKIPKTIIRPSGSFVQGWDNEDISNRVLFFRFNCTWPYVIIQTKNIVSSCG